MEHIKLAGSCPPSPWKHRLYLPAYKGNDTAGLEMLTKQLSLTLKLKIGPVKIAAFGQRGGVLGFRTRIY